MVNTPANTERSNPPGIAPARIPLMSEKPVQYSTGSMTTTWNTAELVVSDHKPLCWRCNSVIAWLVTRPWHLQCRKCKAQNKRNVGDPA